MGFGVCVRNSVDHFVVALTKTSPATMTVLKGEPSVVWYAILCLIHLNLFSLVIETNCKMVVDQIRNKGEDMFESGMILSLKFARREAYRYAHVLAKNSIQLGQHFSLYETPHYIEYIVEMESI